jgi:hypothetical protein
MGGERRRIDEEPEEVEVWRVLSVLFGAGTGCMEQDMEPEVVDREVWEPWK